MNVFHFEGGVSPGGRRRSWWGTTGESESCVISKPWQIKGRHFKRASQAQRHSVTRLGPKGNILAASIKDEVGGMKRRHVRAWVLSADEMRADGFR